MATIYREELLVSLSGSSDLRREYMRYVTESNDSGLSPLLRVRLQAVTANRVTRNGTLYPLEELEGDGVKGYVTVLKPYPIPVMLDHHVTGTLMQSDMPLPVGRAVDARVVRKGRGKEGHLEIDAVIYDQRVIELILDGRFMTVSVGQIPDRVECSVCGEVVNGYLCPSGHERGSTYEWNGDLKRCYYIMRGIEFVEVSFVNIPSDREARVLSKSLDSGTLTSGGLEMTDIDSQVITESAEASVQESFEGNDLSVDTVQSEAPAVESSDEDVELSAEELYLVEGELPYPEAKLTAAQRKRLPDSAFCGPDRSFPAHDKAHVLAGLRLLGRAKLSPAQKARVRACLLRKARQLGMKTGQDREGESAVVFWVFPQSGLQVLEFGLHELPSLPESVGVVMAYDGTVLLELADEQFAALGIRVPHPERTEQDGEVSSDQIAELRQTVEDLENQLREWMDRAVQAEDQLKQVRRETLVSRAVSAAISAGYPLAAGKTVNELHDLFSARSDEFLQTLIEDLGSSSVGEIVEKLTDVKNPLEGLEVGAADGMPIEKAESVQSEPTTRYSAVDELLDALRSGRLRVEENTSEDSVETFRLFF